MPQDRNTVYKKGEIEFTKKEKYVLQNQKNTCYKIITVPWASVATPTQPDDHANAEIEIQFTKNKKYGLQNQRNICYSIREIYFTETSPWASFA